jgi:putative Mg2+ transporter-C (MgtC) family protein
LGTDWFFGHYIDPVSLGGKGLVLLLAVLFGGLIGLERQLHGNAAGMRTHIMVCVGAAVITLASVEIGLGVRGGMRGDPGHIAAQIVSGIGFLGAGAILREGATVRGLTTAASIWTTAGIGIALGASPRLGELAVVATVIVLCTLAILGRLEEIFKLKQDIHALEVEVLEANRGPARVLDLLCAYGVVIYGVQSEPGPASLSKSVMGATRLMRLRMQLPRTFDRNVLNTQLTEEEGVISFHLDQP